MRHCILLTTSDGVNGRHNTVPLSLITAGVPWRYQSVAQRRRWPKPAWTPLNLPLVTWKTSVKTEKRCYSWSCNNNIEAVNFCSGEAKSSYFTDYFTHLSNENFLAVVLDGDGKVSPCPCLIVVLENRQQEHKVSDVEDVLVFITLNKQITSAYHH